MYATALASPGVPGARPSSESSDRFLMCCNIDAPLIDSAAAAACGVTVVDEELDESFALHAVTAVSAASAVTRRIMRIGLKVTESSVAASGRARPHVVSP